jgi:hypothetical protein
LTASACTDPYHLPGGATATSVLVVDGFIYAGSDSTKIRLTRSRNFDDSSATPLELGAHMVLEAQTGGATYPFTELGNGYYGVPSLNLAAGLDYRLHITLASGKQYLSDYVPVVSSPPIDSITYQEVPGTKVTIFANTHDPANKTHYYLWTYVETYEYHSLYYSPAIVVGDSLVPRDTPINVCYLSLPSTDILIGSSASLGADIISQAPLEVIYAFSQKLTVLYSTLVTQIALTPDAYAYWQNMQTNSENLGSIFGPQPFQANGNIHSVSNPAEEVVGYVCLSTPSRQRIFIHNSQLYHWFQPNYNCPVDTDDITKIPPAAFFGPDMLFIEMYKPALWLGVPGDCADCRFDGGNVYKPSFWP